MLTRWLISSGKSWTHFVLGIDLALLLCAGIAPRAAGCPPETLDYGPPCQGEAELIVLAHYGAAGPLVAAPEECARVTRDQELIRGAIPSLAGVSQDEGFLDHYSIWIETLDPADSELACLNSYYQVTSFVEAGFGSWWIITFPRAVNVFAMTEIYQTVPGVLEASTSGGGGCAGACCFSYWWYSLMPDGAWHWTILQSIPFPMHSACRVMYFNVCVTEGGIVFLPGDLNCDGEMNLLDVQSFIEALLAVDTFSGCDVKLADVSLDGDVNGRDIISFVEALLVN